MNRFNLKHRDQPFYPVLTPNLFKGQCSHTYQHNDGLIPYEVEVKVGEICPFCKVIVPKFPRFRIHKRYGHCAHSWSEEYGINPMTDAGHKVLFPGAVCDWCGRTEIQHEDGFTWESLRSKALLERIQEIKPLIVVGSKWYSKSDGETFTVYEVDKINEQYESWMPYVNPHPENTFWYISPEQLAEEYEPI